MLGGDDFRAVRRDFLRRRRLLVRAVTWNQQAQVRTLVCVQFWITVNSGLDSSYPTPLMIPTTTNYTPGAPVPGGAPSEAPAQGPLPHLRHRDAGTCD